MRDLAAIAGIGQTAFSKSLGLSETEVACRAVQAALADAGLRTADVDGLSIYDIESVGVPETVALMGFEHLRFFATHSHGGGSYCAVVQSAAAAVVAGHADTVVCFRARNRGRQSSFGGGTNEGGRPWEKIAPRVTGMYQYQVPLGIAAPAHEMALIARRHMLDYGTTDDHLGEVACAIRSHAVRNPNAIMRTPMTLADHHASRFIAEPLRLLDCCIETDGGTAIVVTSAARARDLRQRPVYVMASVQCVSTAHHHPAEWFALDRRRWITAAASDLWARAGVTAADVDALMVYDHFTPMVLIALEDWGFCGLGESGPFVAGGRLRGPDGALPVNTHGGQLSEAFIHGFNNWNEAVRQLRGTSTCQVPDAEIVMVAAASSDPYGAVLLRR